MPDRATTEADEQGKQALTPAQDIQDTVKRIRGNALAIKRQASGMVGELDQVLIELSKSSAPES